MKVQLVHATSLISWWPFFLLPGGTVLAQRISAAFGCPHLQLVAVRNVNCLQIKPRYVIGAELAWDWATFLGVVRGNERFRDWLLFGSQQTVAHNNAKVEAAWGRLLIGHTPQGTEPLLEVAPRRNETSLEDFLASTKPLVLDSMGFLKVPTVRDRRQKPGAPICWNEDTAIQVTNRTLAFGHLANIFHLQPWRPSWEGQAVLGIEVEKRRLHQLQEYLSGDESSYLHRWVSAIAGHYATTLASNPQPVAIVYEIPPTKVGYLPAMVRQTEHIFAQAIAE